ncbi:MAG: 4Fe-4S dicluster domain-containing protein [Rhodanobacteraceae bacterium]
MTALPPPSKKKLGLVIDLDTCVGCHACAVACKEWNDGGQFGPLPDSDPYGADPDGVWFNRVHTYEVLPRDSSVFAPAVQSLSHNPHPAPAAQDRPLDSRGLKTPDSSQASAIPVPDPRSPLPASQIVHFPRSCLHCETPDCVTVCPTGASYKRAEDGIVLVDEDKCIGCQLCAWACPYGAREISEQHGTMQKCTLCVDRIYNETLDEADRQPACVMACPTRARHFGDLGDPDSQVSQLVARRDGYALMPEYDYKPVNKYLPPRPKRDGSHMTPVAAQTETVDQAQLSPLLKWLDRALSR